MITCYWYNRWWHKRLRKADVNFMLPVIQDACKGDLVKLTKSWNIFKLQEGNEHWYCSCSDVSVEDIRRMAKKGY